MTDRDPNEGSTDPMVPEHWLLGEAAQDKILATGYEQEGVDGIAVDIHDLLQAADFIRDELAPAVVNAGSNIELEAALNRLSQEFAHVEWHARSAQAYLKSVIAKFEA